MRQYEHLHTTTVKVPDGVDIAQFRFVGMDGNYATSAAGLKDSLGASKESSYQGMVPVVTGYSAIIELEAAVVKGDFLKPGVDGKAAVGSATDHCGRAREAGDAGEFVEAIILTHRHV